jgi:hypothetical protein
MNRLYHWEKRSYRDLGNDVIGKASLGAQSHSPPTKDNRARAYNAKIFSGRIRQAVRSVTIRDRGGVLGPSDLCTKTCRPIIDVLHEKHPPLRKHSDSGGSPMSRTSRSWTRQPLT